MNQLSKSVRVANLKEWYTSKLAKITANLKYIVLKDVKQNLYKQTESFYNKASMIFSIE